MRDGRSRGGIRLEIKNCSRVPKHALTGEEKDVKTSQTHTRKTRDNNDKGLGTIP